LLRFSFSARSATARRKRSRCRRSSRAPSASTIRAAPPPGAHCGSCEARSHYRALRLGSSSNPRTRFVCAQNSRVRFNTRLTAMSARQGHDSPGGRVFKCRAGTGESQPSWPGSLPQLPNPHPVDPGLPWWALQGGGCCAGWPCEARRRVIGICLSSGRPINRRAEFPGPRARGRLSRS
jgi:hypothetical protein